MTPNLLQTKAGMLTRNSLWMILARIAAQALTVIFTAVLARRLGAAGFGEYAFVAAMIFVANSLTTFGTDMVLIRQIASRNDLSGLAGALLLQLGLSALLIVGIWLFGERIPNQSAEALAALRIYVLSLIPLAFFTIFTTAMRGKQRLDGYAALNLAAPALQIGLAWLPGLRLVQLCALLVAVQVVVAILAGALCTFTIPGFWKAWFAPLQNMLPLLRACAPLALLTLLGMVYQRLGIYLLSTTANAGQTGLFSAAARVVEASKTLHLAVLAALYPAMAALGNPRISKDGLLRDIRSSRDALLAGGTAAAIVLAILAQPVIHLLYGEAFGSSVPILRVLAWTFIPFTVNSYLTLSFVAAHREWIVARALAVSLLASLMLNLWWIPTAGATGSAWAALAGECIQSAVLLSSARRRPVTEGEVHELSDLSQQA